MYHLPFLLLCGAIRAVFASNGDLHELQARSKPCLNGPKTRNCWTQGFDINTNYYYKWPETGVVRKYYFKVQNTTLAPDGVQVHALTVNGQLPGPTLEGNWGDKFEVYVENQLPVNGTVLHWHGLRQLHSNQYDGVAGVVQCPIAPGKSMVYKFQATEYGSSWYHSHFTVQYAAGVQGGIVIHGPATANYDVDLGSMTIADWTHGSVFYELISQADVNIFPSLNDGLLNGTNVYQPNKTDKPVGKYHENQFEKGKKYRFRLINTSASLAWRFTVDNHKFTIISNDFVPVEPTETDNVILTQGQRYDIVVEANQPVANYWMRAIKVNNGFPDADQPNIRGIIRYVGADAKALPTTRNRFLNHTVNNSNRDFTDSLTPYLKLDVGEDHLDRSVLVTEDKPTALWTMNGTSFLLDWAKPTISELFASANLTTHYNKQLTNASTAPPRYNLPDSYNGTVQTAQNIWHVEQPNRWIWFVLNNIANQTDVHPIHLHGHDFWVLAQGKGRFDPSKDKLNLKNPPRRDVANLLPFGYLVMAFYSDNPGLWLLHCHIAWHVSEGLSLQWLERGSEILQYYDPQLLNDTCREWKAYTKNEVWGQDDSGVKKLSL